LKTNYNERSWGIDLISEANLFLSETDRIIKRVGGEKTISDSFDRLFPDVIIYGEGLKGDILQGWELKMPDTPITNSELIKNAMKKANILGTNSFLLWNVTTAVLYIKEDGDFSPKISWNELSYIKNRDEVEDNKHAWTKLLKKILIYINDYLEKGILKTSSIVNTFSNEQIVNIILANSDSVALNLKNKAAHDSNISSEITSWWISINNEYIYETNPFIVLARIILTNWINKFIFANILKKYYSIASKVDLLTDDITPKYANEIFKEISEKCDFFNVFRTFVGETYITEKSWKELLQFNEFLLDIHFEEVDQELINKVIQKTVQVSKRKIAGQYATPRFLAKILLNVTMKDKYLTIYDPFCGTGTIPRAAYDIKQEYGQNYKEALQTVWASDKFSFLLQVATLSMSDPQNMGEILNVFRMDALDLKDKKLIKLQNPFNGKLINKPLPKFNYIVSNLPFVQKEQLEVANPGIKNINKWIQTIIGKSISGNSDLYAYLPFYLWHILGENGRLGIITSNSWLGTIWGKEFIHILNKFFHIDKVIVSGNKRWFQETKVSTCIIILNKRNNLTIKDFEEKTSFVTVKVPPEILKNQDKIQSISSSIILNQNNEIISNVYSTSEIKELEKYGMFGNSLFANVKWVMDIKDNLVKASNLFNIFRGERRGWDKMFFPKQGHGIEDEYIKPILKSSRSIKGLLTQANDIAFCCSKSVDDLIKAKHKGALNWINRFKNAYNNTGIPLPKCLKRAGMYWYEMKESSMAELVALINYDKKLYIAKMKEKSFINQRLIGFNVIDQENDIDLCHALLNSIISLFYIEALGFGRGLGALDLNKGRISKDFFMLNPKILSKEQKNIIKDKFSKILKRQIFPIEEELIKKDRIDFENEVLKSYNILKYKEKIFDSLMHLYETRISVRE
jgi:hypothetical protein